MEVGVGNSQELLRCRISKLSCLMANMEKRKTLSSYNNNKTVYIFVKLCNFKAAVTVLAVWFVIQNLKMEYGL